MITSRKCSKKRNLYNVAALQIAGVQKIMQSRMALESKRMSLLWFDLAVVDTIDFA